VKLSRAVQWLERDYDTWTLCGTDEDPDAAGLCYTYIENIHGWTLDRENGRPMFEVLSIEHGGVHYRVCWTCEDQGHDDKHWLHGAYQYEYDEPPVTNGINLTMSIEDEVVTWSTSTSGSRP
jgi:hypothetical protein